MAMRQEAEAFAGAILRIADAHVIEFAPLQAMQREAAPADGAGKLPEGVKRLLAAIGEANDAQSRIIRRTDQANRSLAGILLGHIYLRIAKTDRRLKGRVMGKILVLYDSKSGNTERMAQLVAEARGRQIPMTEVSASGKSPPPRPRMSSGAMASRLAARPTWA